MGILYVVATPIGNLEDITYRAVRILGEVDVVAAEDTRKAEILFSRYAIRKKGLVSYFEGNEAKRSTELVRRLVAGESVALITEAGMPGVSDPGQRLVGAAIAAGVRVEVIPGPSVVVSALVLSGLPTERFLFLGFPPRPEGARQELFGTLRGERATMIFYEAPSRVGHTLADLGLALGAERRASVCRELTKLHEEVVRGTLEELAGTYALTAPRGECTLVVAGASADQESEAVDLEAEVRTLVLQGLSPRDVAARLAVKTGKPRRQLYQLALSFRTSAGPR